MVILMVGLAEWAGEKEIIFPEMAALTIGMWVIDKRVWKVRRWQIIWMMTAGSGCRSLYRALFSFAVALQFMYGFYLCCLLPDVQPDHIDPIDFGLHAACVAAY